MGFRSLAISIATLICVATEIQAQTLQPVPYPYGSQRVIQRWTDPSIIIRPDSQGLVPVGPPCPPEGCDPAAPDQSAPEPRPAGHWSWSAPAPYHRTSVVRVRAGGYAGAGVLVEGDIVLTAKHVIGHTATATATWLDGQSRSGDVFYSSTGEDLAGFVIDPPPGAVALKIADAPPPIGVSVEYHGFGGPKPTGDVDILRHYLGRASRSQSDTLIGEASALHGDSGGPAIYQGQLVGVITGGQYTREFGLGGGGMSTWPLVYPVRSVCVGPIRAFVGRLRQRYQQQQQQQQRYGQPPPPTPEYFPPPPQEQPTPIPEAKPDPYENLPGEITEHGARLDAIESRLESIGTSTESTVVSIEQIQTDLRQLAERQPDVASLTTRIESVQQVATEAKEHVTHVESSLLKRITGLASKDEVRDTFSAAVQQAREEDVGVLESAKQATVAVVANETKNLTGWTVGKTVAGALGLSGPLALGLSLAGWFVGRRLRKRIGGASEGPFEAPAVDTVERPQAAPDSEPPSESSQSRLPDMDEMRKQLSRCKDARSQLIDQLNECREARGKLESEFAESSEDGSRKTEQLESRIKQLQLELTGKDKEIENLFVRVPATDPHGLAYKKAINMFGNANPQTSATLKRIEALKDQILHGMKVKDGKVIGWDDDVEIPLDKI